MIRKTVVALSTLFFFVATINSAEITKVLQVGQDDYTGCEDAYICHQGYDNLEESDDPLNHEGDSKLHLKMCTT